MFVHLRLHTEFSVVDGTNRIDDVVKAAAQDGQPALAITDLNKAIEINPNLDGAYCGRGTVYCEKGNYGQALMDFGKATERPTIGCNIVC